MQYKLITFRYDGKPNIIEGNYEQLLNIHVGTVDDKISQWFSHKSVIPMDQYVGTLNFVLEEIQRQAIEYVEINFNNNI